MADNTGVNPYKPIKIDIQSRAKLLVFHYILESLTPEEAEAFSQDEVFIVWYVKTLKNWKALVSSSIPDGKYYELTYDGHREVTYVDVYQKADHFEVLDEPWRDN